MVAVLSQFLFGNKFFILTGFSIVAMSVSFSIDLYNRTIYILKKSMVWDVGKDFNITNGHFIIYYYKLPLTTLALCHN